MRPAVSPVWKFVSNGEQNGYIVNKKIKNRLVHSDGWLLLLHLYCRINYPTVEGKRGYAYENSIFPGNNWLIRFTFFFVSDKYFQLI